MLENPSLKPLAKREVHFVYSWANNAEIILCWFRNNHNSSNTTHVSSTLTATVILVVQNYLILVHEVMNWHINYLVVAYVICERASSGKAGSSVTQNNTFFVQMLILFFLSTCIPVQFGNEQ